MLGEGGAWFLVKSAQMGISVLNVPLRWLVVQAVVATWLLVPGAGSVSAAELPVGATLSVLADPVEVAGLGDGIFGTASSGQTLRAGDTVRTGSSGIAVLTFFDGSETQLGSSSQLQIEQADYSDAPQIALFQTQGTSVNRVIPLPPGGSFRTDTPDAAGLVRGTSYVVNVGSAGSTLVLLTDRDGHVGRVQVVPAQVDNVVDLVRAGDVGSTSHASWRQSQTTSASHLNADTLATLEQDAKDLHDADGAQAVTGALGAAVAPAATDDQGGNGQAANSDAQPGNSAAAQAQQGNSLVAHAGLAPAQQGNSAAAQAQQGNSAVAHSASSPDDSSNTNGGDANGGATSSSGNRSTSSGSPTSSSGGGTTHSGSSHASSSPTTTTSGNTGRNGQ